MGPKWMGPTGMNETLQKYVHDVCRFHQAMVLHIGDPRAPGFLNDDEARLRARLLNEEIGETINKGIAGGPEGSGPRTLDGTRGAPDLIELIDGLVDTLYVAIGTSISVGFDVVPLVPWNEPKVAHDPRLLLSRSQYFREMLTGACRAACAAIDARDVDACKATTIGMLYVLNAVVNAWNIPLEPFWDEVQRANMEKLPPDQPGGKVRKPPGWRGPDHRPIFYRVFGLAEDVGSGPAPLFHATPDHVPGNCPGIAGRPRRTTLTGWNGGEGSAA
jgi:predicted HAD superfamily Cof-like phosphohydrolase